MTATTSHDTRNAPSPVGATHQRSVPKSNTQTQHDFKAELSGEPVEINVSELVLSAQCELAMARVEGPLDMRCGFARALAARRWAYRAGRASLSGARIPIGIAQSQVLVEGWHAGQAARARSINGVCLALG